MNAIPVWGFSCQGRFHPVLFFSYGPPNLKRKQVNMKIKIKIETESGADLRRGLMGILYDITLEEQPATSAPADSSPQPQSLPVAKKRATKAELDAKKAEEQSAVNTDSTTEQQTPVAAETAPVAESTTAPAETSTAPAETAPAAEVATPMTQPVETTPSANTGTANEITKAFLTPIVIQKGREGKRESVVALLTKYGALNAKGEAGLPNLDPAKYTEFHSELIGL